jgi:hypothetical protein
LDKIQKLLLSRLELALNDFTLHKEPYFREQRKLDQTVAGLSHGVYKG